MSSSPCQGKPNSSKGMTSAPLRKSIMQINRPAQETSREHRDPESMRHHLGHGEEPASEYIKTSQRPKDLIYPCNELFQAMHFCPLYSLYHPPPLQIWKFNIFTFMVHKLFLPFTIFKCFFVLFFFNCSGQSGFSKKGIIFYIQII